MLQSIRDKIVTAFCDALAADGGPQVNDKNIPVFRSATRPLVRDDSLPGYVVTPASETVEASDHETQLRTLNLRVVCAYGGTDTEDETIDQKVEPQTSWVEQCIAADETLGGLANRSEVSGITWHIDDADEVYIGAEMNVQIQYFTARNQPDVGEAA